jgi:hypothetical protein
VADSHLAGRRVHPEELFKDLFGDNQLIASWNDPGIFHHENHSSLGRSGAMENSLRYYEPMPGTQLDSAIFQIDQQLSFNHIKKFVIFIVFVPVILTFHDAQPHDRLVHLTQCLVKPFVGTTIREAFLVDYVQRLVIQIQARFIWIGL